ncbi:aldose epimerase family protein [Pseudonocardia nigra]|uniref:aldose epimerase family protein n=1 Tax=Pseudonocardia nigra TaxID=1921578 RepID=UPI0027E34A6A|nr:hypothetical protein [Pseudonocardia nigra]
MLGEPGKDGFRLAAHVTDPHSGRELTVHTTELGVQLYTGNFLDGSLVGIGDKVYRQGEAFCLETPALPRLAEPRQLPVHGPAPGRDPHLDDDLHVLGEVARAPTSVRRAPGARRSRRNARAHPKANFATDSSIRTWTDQPAKAA